MADYNSLQRKRNMVVGGFVVVGLAILFYMIFLFGELPVAVSKLRSYRVIVDFRTAPGVTENTPVKYCGYQVGRVISVLPPSLRTDEQTGKNYHVVRVTMALDKSKELNIPSTVEVKLMKRGLGSSFIDLQVDPDKPLVAMDPKRDETKYLFEGAVLVGGTGVQSDFFPEEVQQKIEALVDSVNALAVHVEEIIGDNDNKNNIRQTLANMAEMTRQATATLTTFEKFTDKSGLALQGTAEKLNDTLVEMRTLLNKINNGNGTAGMLLNDARLYENLLESSEELKLTLEEFKGVATQVKEEGVNVKLF